MTRPAALLLACLVLAPAGARGADVPAIGSRRELFLDRLLVDRLDGATLVLHEPRMAPEVSPARPDGHYATVLATDGLFRCYYRGAKDPAVTWKTHGVEASAGNEVTLYSESPDGIHWTQPNLGLFPHPAFPAGNVVLADEPFVNHNFTPFLDTKPGVPAAERYKALGGNAFQPHQADIRERQGPGGLKAFVSADGIHWKKLRDEAVIPEEWGKYFDSQNLAFWSEAEGCYVCYFRRFIRGLRGIARTTSQDFVHWTPFVEIEVNLPGEHLYTSGVKPYVRAPHLLVALPTRFMDKRSAATDVLIMSSRGGDRFDREFTQAFIRPGLGGENWANRANYAALGIHQTRPARRYRASPSTTARRSGATRSPASWRGRRRPTSPRSPVAPYGCGSS
jgi:hypothetical protein